MKPMIKGINFNCLDLFPKNFPDRYVLTSDSVCNAAIQQLWTISEQTDTRRVRTLLFPASKPWVKTSYLHVPFNNMEVERIQRYIVNNPLAVQLAFGPLWEALWLEQEEIFPGENHVLPQNPFKTPEELFAAIQEGIWKVLFSNGFIPPEDFSIDLWSEFEKVDMPDNPLDNELPIMAPWYTWLLSALRDSWPKIKKTVSVIYDGSIQRCIDNYEWLANLGCGLPDFAQIHINGITDETIIERWADDIHLFRYQFSNIPVVIGEDDMCPRSNKAMEAICRSGVEEYIVWRCKK
jgi:hypothetical protein